VPLSRSIPLAPARSGAGWRRLFVQAWFALFACGLAAPGQAASLDAADAKAVRAVIEAQLEAFAADDAVRAFSYASEGIRRQFVDPERFMAMVRAGYPMVLRPRSASFFQAQRAPTGVFQVVQLRDRSGQLWRATYLLEQQADRSWRIGGCVVEPGDAASTT
jgi:hypothetical protein